jgi:hypothetical protein
MATQILGRVRLVFKGAYNSGVTYKELDSVHYQGSAYVMVNRNDKVGITPGTDPDVWNIIVDTGLTDTIARLDSDSAEIQSLRTDLDAEITATNTDITAIKARLDSDDARLQAIDTQIANLSSDSIVDADGNTKIQVEESSDENKIRFDTAGTERLVISETGAITAGTGYVPSAALDVATKDYVDDQMVNLADSDLIITQLNQRVTSILNQLDSDSTVIQSLNTQKASLSGATFTGLVTMNGGLTIQSGDSFTFDGNAFTDAHKLEIRNSSNSVVFGGWVLDTDSTVAN